MNAPTTPDESGLLQKAERINEILRGLEAILPQHSLLHSREETTPYECDGLTAYRQRPLAVALPETYRPGAGRAAAPVPPPWASAGGGPGRGHGPVGWGDAACRDGVTLSLAQLQPHPGHVMPLQPHGAWCSAGCATWPSARRLRPAGPVLRARPFSSQIACTIGGNVAENSGGVHCLKYGLTVHNVLKVRGFTVAGEPVEFGGEALDAPGLRPAGRVDGQRGPALRRSPR
jgi:glycolate oxidase